MSTPAHTDWLPLDEGWIPTSLAPPLDSREAGDLARCAHACAHVAAISSNPMERVASAAMYRVAGDYYSLARQFANEVEA